MSVKLSRNISCFQRVLALLCRVVKVGFTKYVGASLRLAPAYYFDYQQLTVSPTFSLGGCVKHPNKHRELFRSNEQKTSNQFTNSHSGASEKTS